MPSIRVEDASRGRGGKATSRLPSGPPKLKKRTYTQAQAAAMKASVRGNLREICAEYFNWAGIQDYHIEILEAMFEGGYLIVNVPTDHAKSTMGTFLFPILSLMENPDESHLVCGANLNDSRRRVMAIGRELETNAKLIYDWPWLARPDARAGREWTSTSITVEGRRENKPNPSVIATAIGSSDIKGRRGKLLMDDIEGEDSRWSPVKREQLYSWLKLEAWRCFEDVRETSRPLLCLMGTPFDVDSIYFRMESQGWKTIRYPVYRPKESGERISYDDLRDPDLYHNLGYLWPAKKEKVDRAHRSLTKIEFSVAYLMDPTGGDPNVLSSTEIAARMATMKQLENDVVTFVSLDPASGGGGRKQDYAGIAVVRINWPAGDTLPNVELPTCYSFTEGLFEQVQLCADLAAHYNCPLIYEGNSQQGEVYAQTFKHLRPETKLHRYHTTKSNKFDARMGLTVIKRLVVDRRLWVDPQKVEEEGFQNLIAEIRDLAPPFTAHNHISAAIWFAVRFVYEQVRHLKGPIIRTTYGRPPAWHGPRWADSNNQQEFRDEPTLSPLARAMQAMAYDRQARQGPRAIMGYRAIRHYAGNAGILERERRKEEMRFHQALTRPRDE